MTKISEASARHLHLLIAERQSKHRVPGIAAGVARDGDPLWSDGVGAADIARPDQAPNDDTQFLIASNTKTFTAVLVMSLRDEEAQPGRHGREVRPGEQARGSHDPPDPRPRHRDAAGAGRRRVGRPGVARPHGAHRELERGRADPQAALQVALLQPGLLRPGRDRRADRRSGVVGVPAGEDPRPARDAAYDGGLGGPHGDGLLRPAFQRHTGHRAGRGRQGDGCGRRTGQHGARHGDVGILPGRPDGRCAEWRHPRRDVPATDRGRPGGLAAGLGARPDAAAREGQGVGRP